jgi:hypothetical protein
MENKETFEEAVVNSWLDYEHVEGHLYSTTYRAGFEAGAKWQAERMYNGKAPEMLEMLEKVVKYYHIYESDILDEAEQLIKEATEI